jgi:hypothetical protein
MLFKGISPLFELVKYYFPYFLNFILSDLFFEFEIALVHVLL